MMEPNFESIFITNGIGLMLAISLLVSIYITRDMYHVDDRIFTVLISISVGSCICEPLSWFANARPEPWAFFLNYFCNAYLYLGASICPYLWVLYVDARLHKGREHIRSYFPIVLVPTVLLFLLNVCNLFGHFMFTIDENNVYSRQPLSYLNYVMMFVTLFYSVWVKFKFQRKHGKVRFFPMTLFLVPMFIGAGVQAALYGVSTAWAGICIGLVSIYMSIQNELSYVDQLTNLYNRTFFDGSLRTIGHGGEQFGGIMIDLDYFKAINDTYGHSVGDDALQQTAQLLTKAAPAKASVIRYAGDEFIILLPTGSESEIESVEQAICDAVKEFNANAGKPYNIFLSMGHSTFVPGKDTTDQFLRRIDEQMYKQKREHHSQQQAAQLQAEPVASS